MNPTDSGHTEIAAKMRSGDPDRLIEGENPGTESVGEVNHWLGVYRELLSIKEPMLQQFESVATMASSSAALELKLTDLAVFRAQVARLKRRQAFWEEHKRQLTGGD